MASRAEDLPSCSKASTSLSNKGIHAWNINKFPVVVLAKLDLSTVSVKLSAEDLKALEKQKTSTLGLPRRAVDKPAQKNAWCDEDTVMSDISACLSDSEETEATDTKGNKDRSPHKEKLEKTSVQDKTKYDSHSRSGIQDPSKNDNKKNFKKGMKETINKEGKLVTEKHLSLVVKKEIIPEKVDVETELDEGKHRTDKRDKTKTGKTEKDVKNETDHQAKSVQKALLNQQSSLVKEIKQDDRDAGGSQPASSRNGKLRALKRPVRAEEVDSPNVKKSKTEDIMEMISVNQETQMKNKNKMQSSNTRYKLSLGPVHMSDLGDESFRKFINLATDCVVSFNRKNSASGSMDGNVELYFGDFQMIQSAIQRLGQLTVIASKAMIQGCIKCFDLQPRAKKDSKGRWTTNISAKLYFKFNAGKVEKLQQLVSSKSKSKEDTKRKFIHLHRIPSSINEEMLNLLFPFSVGVKISHDESSEKALKGPVEIEFESQEWMEAVLACFQDFNVCSSGSFDRIFNLRIKGVASPKSQTNFPVLATSNKQQKPFTGGQGQKRGNMNESKSFKGQYQKPFLERKVGGNNVAGRQGGMQSKFNQRKQQSSASANFGQMGNRNVAMNRTFGSNGQARGPVMMDRNRIEQQTQILLEPDIRRNSLRQLALNRGLDPNNPDVMKILEVTAHLETLQNTSMPQRPEAHGIMGLPAQQVNPERLRDQGVQKRGFESAEQLAGFRPHNDPAWQGLEKAFKEERFKQEEAADRERRLEEFERTVKQPQRKGPGVKIMNPKFPTQTSKTRKSAKQIQTYRDAPATEGLLGPAPSRNDEQFEKRTWDDGNQFHQMSVDPDRNDRPLDFNRPILSAEQAFKQDIERTRAILSAHRDGSTGRSINYHAEAKYPFLEETRDLHALPVQFGKNAAKKNPKEFERRRTAEVNQNTRDESVFPRSNDRFTGAHRINPSDSFQTGRDSTFMERQEGSAEVFQSNYRDPYRIMDRKAGSLDRESFIHREERDALQRWEATDIKEQRAGLLGTIPRSGNLFSDLPVESGTQRIGPFERNEAARSQLSKNFEEFDLQARRDSLNLENEILRRKQELIRSQGDLALQDWTRERELLYRREPVMEQFHQNSELKEAGWARSSHAPVKKNEIYQEKILEEARWHEEPQPFKQPARVQQQVDVKERSAVYRGAHFTGASTGPRASRFPQADEDYQRNPAVFKRDHTDSAGVAAFERQHLQGDHKTPSFKHPIKRGGSVSQMKGSRGGNVSQQQRGNVNHSMVGRGTLSARKNVNAGVLGSGRGLLQLPQEFQQGGANCERRPEVGDQGVGFGSPHQYQNRNARAFPAMPQPPLPPSFLGQRGGHGVNFF